MVVQIKFAKGSGNKKYKAVIYEDGEKIKTVQFGDSRYQHYKDRVPLKLWKHLDHNDINRRNSYRARHSAIKTSDGTPAYKVLYSPAYFSYNYLW